MSPFATPEPGVAWTDGTDDAITDHIQAANAEPAADRDFLIPGDFLGVDDGTPAPGGVHDLDSAHAGLRFDPTTVQSCAGIATGPTCPAAVCDVYAVIVGTDGGDGDVVLSVQGFLNNCPAKTVTVSGFLPTRVLIGEGLQAIPLDDDSFIANVRINRVADNVADDLAEDLTLYRVQLVAA